MALTASQILDKHWDGNLPIDVIFIAQRLGINIQKAIRLPDDASGMIEFKNGTPVCTVNQTHSHERQRFTIAHEIGHWALGHISSEKQVAFRDTSENFSINHYDQKEVLANKFAAELLIPKDAIEYMVFKADVNDLTDLANIFQVSTAAMVYRLKNLGVM